MMKDFAGAAYQKIKVNTMIVLDEIRPRNSNMSMINDRYVCMVDPALIK
jgi:hypothetical protein